MIPIKDDLCISLAAGVKDAIAALDAGGHGIALVVDDQRRLLGVLTDHDVRRALLKGAGLLASVEPFVNRSPVVAMADQPRDEIFELMRRRRRSPIPLLDTSGRVVGLESLSSILTPGSLADHSAVIMAGGLGSRLHPLTLRHPKGMLTIHGKPILQIILENLKAYGFQRVYIAVHFQREIIENYFGDGRDLDLQIEYLREEEPLGTAGALALLPTRPVRPLVVMNGDLLTHVNMESLIDYHIRAGGRFTMCVRAYELQIPFGVVRLDGSQVVAIEEKPVHGCFVNAGIYVMDPEVLDLIQAPMPLDMTDLISKTLEKWEGVNSFPIHEYWLDVGQHEDYERARLDYQPRR